MCRRLLCYGDSNTYGYDPRSYLGGRYPESVRWTALLNAGGWKVINKGENGRSIPKLDQEIETAKQTVRSIDTDILAVMLGSNDLLQCPDLAAEVCGERMERFLRVVLTQTQGSAKILLVAPPPMEPGAWVSSPRIIEESRKLAKFYEATAHRLAIAFTNAGSWGVELAYDGEWIPLFELFYRKVGFFLCLSPWRARGFYICPCARRLEKILKRKRKIFM